MPDPARPAPWCDTIHTLTLCLWLAALILGGASAAVVFPTMKSVNPTLPDFPGFEADHWKIAAGVVQQRIFVVSDIVQLIAAAAAFLTLGLRLSGWGVPRAQRRRATLVRALAVAAAMLLLSYHLLILAPRLSLNIAEYYEHARAGRVPEARASQALFDADHPAASRILTVTAACVLTALCASLWSLARPVEDPSTT